MVIFLLLLRERRTIDETERHRTVARLKNLANVKRREREEGEEREREGIRKEAVGRIEAERRKILEPYRLVYSRSDNNSGDASRSFSRETSFKAFRLESFSYTPYQSRSNSTAVKENATLGSRDGGQPMYIYRCTYFSIYKAKSILRAVGNPTQTIRSFTRHTIRIVKKNKG